MAPWSGETYSLPAGTTVSPNTTIQSTWANTLTADLQSGMNFTRPISRGGTGATTASGARDELGVTTALGTKLNVDGSNVGDEAAQAAFLSEVTGTEWAEGDIGYINAEGRLVRLAKGAAGQVLRQNDGETAPEWGAAPLTQVLHIQEQQPDGTTAGGFSAGAWRTRNLNTVITNSISGAALSSQRITLPAGTYDVFARAPGYEVQYHKTRLQDVTNDITLGEGSITRAQSNDVWSESFVSIRFTLTEEVEIELQHICSSTVSDSGFGPGGPGGWGIGVFSEIEIRRVA